MLLGVGSEPGVRCDGHHEKASRLFFNAPLWRNLFENTLTVQFDHRT
jgi:hypothetical protein